MIFGWFRRKPPPPEPSTVPLGPCDPCGGAADYRSTGAEVDPRGLGRTAQPKLNVCPHHYDWIFSDDAREAIVRSADKYHARK